MRIKNITLKNFKRFDNLTVDLGDNPKKIISLVGPNGCGKSSVLDGFLFLQNSYDAIGAFGRKEASFYSKEEDSSYFNNILEKVNIEFDTGFFDKIFREKQTSQLHKTIFSYRSPYRVSQQLNVKGLSTMPNLELNNLGASHSVDLDEKVIQNYQRLYVHLEKYRKKNDLTDEQAITHVLNELNAVLEQCLDLKIADIGDILDGRGKLFFEKKDQKDRIDFNVLSSGEKEVVDILLDIFIKRDVYHDTIFIIDEPELHLNTHIQRKLLREVEKLVPDNCQLWVATHSIGFLRALQEDLKDVSQVLDFGETDYFTGEKSIRPIQRTRKNWVRIFKTALEDITGLLAPERIIYVEGKINASLDEKMFNTIFENTHTEAMFISSGSKTDVEKHSAIALRILNKAFDDVSITALIDHDEDLEGPVKKGNVVIKKLKRKEFENYLLDKEVLRLAFSDFNEQSYEKLVIDITNDDVKTMAPKILKQCCKSTWDKETRYKLAENIKPETKIYKELEETIFN